MKNLKKLFLLMFVAVLSLTMVACGEDKPADDNNVDPSTVELDKDLSADLKGLCEGRDVYLTTVGQSDLAVVQQLVKTAGIEATSNATLTAEEVVKTEGNEKAPVLLLVTGTSGKGLGSAGTNWQAEETRGQAFAGKADNEELVLVVFHVGKQPRRGATTDPILDAVCPSASVMLVVNGAAADTATGGNFDGYFTKSSEANNVPLYLYSSASKLVAPVKTLFNK